MEGEGEEEEERPWEQGVAAVFALGWGHCLTVVCSQRVSSHSCGTLREWLPDPFHVRGL